MAKMKVVQPQMTAIKERFPDDKQKQQQEMMELYKREKINPVAGCLPMLIQIPVFFALYKVIFVTIEMRQAPFFGWIRDLSAPDPTNVFTLFGLIPWDPTQMPIVGHFLAIGIWPVDHGLHAIRPDEDEPGAAGSGAETDVQLDAGDLHLHAGHVSGGSGDLLDLEQYAVDHPADPDHEEIRR